MEKIQRPREHRAINRRFTPIIADGDFFTAETPFDRRDSFKDWFFCPIAVSRLGKNFLPLRLCGEILKKIFICVHLRKSAVK